MLRLQLSMAPPPPACHRPAPCHVYRCSWLREACCAKAQCVQGGALRLQVYGASRRIFDALHGMSLAGQSLYVEALLPTAAMLHGLKAVRIEAAPPFFDAYDCGDGRAEALYLSFALNQSCTKSMLLHPVKADVTH